MTLPGDRSITAPVAASMASLPGSRTPVPEKSKLYARRKSAPLGSNLVGYSVSAFVGGLQGLGSVSHGRAPFGSTCGRDFQPDR